MLAEQRLEELAGGADEGPPLLVLVVAGGLADEHDLGVDGAFAGHGVGARWRRGDRRGSR